MYPLLINWAIGWTTNHSLFVCS